jgi:hypothetical protein
VVISRHYGLVQPVARLRRVGNVIELCRRQDRVLSTGVSMPCTLTPKAVSIHIDASCSIMSSSGRKMPSDRRELHHREADDARKRSGRSCSDGGGTRLHIISHEPVHPLVMSTNRACHVSHSKGVSQCQVIGLTYVHSFGKPAWRIKLQCSLLLGIYTKYQYLSSLSVLGTQRGTRP